MEAFSAIKDPTGVLDYAFNWSSWIVGADTIQSATVTAETGLTVTPGSVSTTTTSVLFELSGGTAEEDYIVACHVVTAEGREDTRRLLVQVRPR